jgi:hypothetical protein
MRITPRTGFEATPSSASICSRPSCGAEVAGMRKQLDQKTTSNSGQFRRHRQKLRFVHHLEVASTSLVDEQGTRFLQLRECCDVLQLPMTHRE